MTTIGNLGTELDIDVARGSDYTFTVEIRDDSSALVDVSQLLMWVETGLDPFGVTHVSTGTFEISLSRDTTDLLPGCTKYTIGCVDVDGEHRPLLYGTINVPSHIRIGDDSAPAVPPVPPSSGAPGRTLFVATSWPAGVDTTKCFTDIPSALAAVAALTPPPDVSHPAVIMLYAGLYSAPITLVSNVHFVGVAARGCSITGTVTYTPGVGVNAYQTGSFERVYFSELGISGSTTFDATGKTGSSAVVDFRNVDISASLTARGRAATLGSQDEFHIWNGIHGGTAWSFTGIKPLFYGGVELDAGSVTVTDCVFGAIFNDAQCFAALNLVNTSVTAHGSKFSAVNVDGTSVFGPVPGGKVGVVTVAAGGTADVRSAEYFTASNLVGPGAIDRSVWRTTIGPTTVGANTVTLTPPYIDANYNVQVTQTDGTPTAIIVAGKQAGQFTLNDSVGGNTFDVTVVKE